MQQIYIATGNDAKLQDFINLFAQIDKKISVEKVPDYVSVEETGKDLFENSKLKVLPYKNKYDIAVVANDSGLFFDPSLGIDLDPAKIKRNALNGKNEKDLSQEKVGEAMFNYYKELARKHGGTIPCQWRDVFTILTPEQQIFQRQTIRNYELIDRDTPKYNLFHPLNALRKSILTKTFVEDMNEEDHKKDGAVMVEALKELISL